MKKLALILSILLLGIIFSGCTDQPEKTDLAKNTEDNTTVSGQNEIDSLFDEELDKIDSDNDLTSLEDELV